MEENREKKLKIKERNRTNKYYVQEKASNKNRGKNVKKKLF